MRDMMHRLIDSFSPAYLEPMTLSELYQRMCMNLVDLSAPPLSQLPIHLTRLSPARVIMSHRRAVDWLFAFSAGMQHIRLQGWGYCL